MSCSNRVYKDIGTSIYCKRGDISNNQRLFTTNLPAYHQLDLSTRYKNGTKSYSNRCNRHKRLNKTLSHSDILKIKLSQSYFNPKSFKRIKKK
jgi:hypothetical protein